MRTPMKTKPNRTLKPAPTTLASPDVDRLRLERLMHDAVTGLPLHPLLDVRSERIAHLGVIYIQLGRFAGVESLCGWELYDRILRVTSDGLNEDLLVSELKPSYLSTLFNGADGFFLLFDLPARPGFRRRAGMDAEAERLRQGVVRRLRQAFGRTAVDLMNVYASSVLAPDDPRVRPTRNLVRALAEAARHVEARETGERLGQVALLKQIISERRLRMVFQPVCDLKTGAVLGHEALARGPSGSELETADALFSAARESDMLIELENLCLETIFSSLPRAVREGVLFVNASARLVTHPVFLDERNLVEIRRAHAAVVVELSEKEIVGHYPSFREVLERLRGAGLRLAIDDAGSGYSGLESILQLRPEYIKVSGAIVHRLHLDRIKREIVSALASLARPIGARVVAEGIEAREELASLLELGVTLGQGFLLGRPAARVTSGAGRPAFRLKGA